MVRTAFGLLSAAFLFATSAAPQAAPACPGGRLITSFQLEAEPSPEAIPLALDKVNDLVPGDTLNYVPSPLPPAWRGSAKIAVLFLPTTTDPQSELDVVSAAGDKDASFPVPQASGAVAFLFGPQGLNPQKSRTLLAAHPELVAHFVQYAEQASRVEALVALFARYEQSPPGSLDLNAMLKEYAEQYGISVPKVNPALSPDQQAAELLAAVAPPTAGAPPPSHAALRSGSRSTAAALASLYFGPTMGIANDTIPLFQALRQSMFPGIEFQGAFATPAAAGMSLCIANTAPAEKKPVYIWMVNLPGGIVPSLRMAKSTAATVPAGWQSALEVTGGSVAQLRQVARVRQWELVSTTAKIPIDIAVKVGEVSDTLTLDLRHLKIAPGNYQLTGMWDWTPVPVAGMVTVRDIPSLAGVKLAPGAGDRIEAGAGVVPIEMLGGDFSFVNKIELAPAEKGAAAVPVSFVPPAPDSATALGVKLDTAKLKAGNYELRVIEVNGAQQAVPIAVHAPNPSLTHLPLPANLGENTRTITLQGQDLELIHAIASPDAEWRLAPPAAVGMTKREATVSLSSHAKAGELMPATLTVTGLDAPLVVPGVLRVLPPRPHMHSLTPSPSSSSVALLPGEIGADATANFTFAVDQSELRPTLHLACQEADLTRQPLALHAGDGASATGGDFEAAGGGLFYLALTPGTVGDPGCTLQMTVHDADSGDSEAVTLGRVVRLPQIQHFTLSNDSPGTNLYAGELSGNNLQLIAKTGWTPDAGIPVTAIPMRGAGADAAQTLAIVMPWPPPAPHAPLYIWLRGETQGRKTTVTP